MKFNWNLWLHAGFIAYGIMSFITALLYSFGLEYNNQTLINYSLQAWLLAFIPIYFYLIAYAIKHFGYWFNHLKAWWFG